MSETDDAAVPDETGSSVPDTRLVPARIGPFTAMVRVTATGQFVDIESIRVAKDFRSIRQRVSGAGFHDVSDLYEDKEK